MNSNGKHELQRFVSYPRFSASFKNMVLVILPIEFLKSKKKGRSYAETINCLGL